jgi:hypothetical protein
MPNWRHSRFAKTGRWMCCSLADIRAITSSERRFWKLWQKWLTNIIWTVRACVGWLNRRWDGFCRWKSTEDLPQSGQLQGPHFRPGLLRGALVRQDCA